MAKKGKPYVKGRSKFRYSYRSDTGRVKEKYNSKTRKWAMVKGSGQKKVRGKWT